MSACPFRILCLAILLVGGLSGCATGAPQATVGAAVPAPSCSPGEPGGTLVVYTTTYPQTAEQSEYPAHTNYTISRTDGGVIAHVANNTGPFGTFPSAVGLPCGNYDVRAQYGSGRFVVVPVAVGPGKTTVIDLTDEPVALGVGSVREPIRLPSGQVVGWRATTGG